MSVEVLKVRLKAKSQTIERELKDLWAVGGPPEKFEALRRKVDLVGNLYFFLEEMMTTASDNLSLVTISSKVGVVDDRVINDPVGQNLYTFGWRGELPTYIKEDGFLEKMRLKWEELEEEGQRHALVLYRALGDLDTQKFFAQASEEELFRFWLDNNVREPEKNFAGAAMFHMANRRLTKEEYRFWAGRFYISLDEA